MATPFSYPNNITAGTPAVAAEVQDNFDDLLAWITSYYQQTLDTTAEIAASALLLDGSNAMAADLAMGSNKITGLATPTATTDATNKTYVDNVTINIGNVSGSTVEGGTTDRGPNGTADLTVGTFNLGSNGTYKLFWRSTFGVTSFILQIYIGTGGGFGTWTQGVQIPANVPTGLAVPYSWPFNALYINGGTNEYHQGYAVGSGLLGADYLGLYYQGGASDGELERITSTAPFSWGSGDVIMIQGVVHTTWPEF